MAERDQKQSPQSRNNPQQPQQGQAHGSQNQQSQSGVSGLGDSDQARGGGQRSTGQQQQFESHKGQQSGGNAGSSSFADQIRPHQDVVDDGGKHVGTVDHVEGDRIKLARSDSNDGQHHYVLLSQVAGIEGGKVRLRERGDNDFGEEAGR